MIPWPRGTRVQCVHADDVAQAYLAAVRARAGGAFNIAAPDVLRDGQVAALLSGGRRVTVPNGMIRGAAAAAWNARVIPASPGWLDLASTSPVLTATRARDVLGWRPTHSGFETMAEVLDGIADGAGTSSPPLRPRRGAKGTVQTRTQPSLAREG